MKVSREEFEAAYEKFDGDKQKLAEYFGVALATVYNWYNRFIRYKDMPDLVKLYKEHQKIKSAENKAQLEFNNDILVVCMSDIHIGSVHTDIDRLMDDLELIAKTPNVYVVFGGDAVDYNHGGPQDLLNEQVFSNPYYIKIMIEDVIFSKIMDKLIAIVSGCHDNWGYNNTGGYFLEEIAKNTKFGIFSPDQITLDLKVGEIKYKMFVSHKARGGGAVNPWNAIFRKAEREIDIDVGFVAHKHTPAIAVRNIRGKRVVAVNGGTYKKIDKYASSLGITQQPLSIPGLFFSSEEKTIIPLFDWRDGLRLV